MFETFDHTADLGLRVRAADLNSLFADAGVALFSTIVENLDAVAPVHSLELRIAGEDRAYLFFDWLKELLYRFDSEGWLLSRFDVKVADDGLTAVAWGEKRDDARHELGHEVKAITYHGLKVEPVNSGWLAEVIVDI